ncbi:MAG TPA: hypothetical protein VM938_14415 [Acidimicrobiales bacterium]|nr:hypothetical protein [Acidimicrobiales bacterium]
MRLLLLALRATWALLPFTVGGGLAAALDERVRGVQVAGSALGWGVWALVLVATLVPHPVSLTALRVAAPAVVGVALWSGSPLGAVAGLVTVGLAFAAETGVEFVNGSAYPNERRFPLRPPGFLLFGTVELAWALAVGGPVAGVLLIGAGRGAAGAAVLVVAVAVAVVLVRSLHGLSRRWVVFVPAGLVLHDGMALADPVLFQRKVVEAVRLAPADTDSLDLTKGALGPAVELLLREKVPMVLTTPGNRGGEPGSSARLLFSPTRPGAVLAEAARRRLVR